MENLKIVLIYLPHPYLIEPDAQVPIGLMYLGAVLQKKHDVRICNYSSFTTEEALADLPQADLYGITVTSLELGQANRFSQRIKQQHPGARVVLGGPGVVTEGDVDRNYVDAICMGDGEEAVLDIVSDMPNLKKVYSKPVKDLDKLPLPSRRLMSDCLGGSIFAYKKNYDSGGSTVIVSIRGCAYNCAFCAAPKLREINGGVRFRSPQNIYEEMREVIKEYGIRQFRFSDDMFTLNKKRAMAICDVIGGLGVYWRISGRVKPFDREIAQAMYDAGCKEVSFGIESFDDDVLKLLRKGATVADNVNALEIAAKVGMKARILLMVKTPGQTPEAIAKNIKWLKRVPYTIAACTTFIPIPGCDIWYYPERYGIEILDRDLDNYNFYFYSSNGENEVKNLIRLKGRDENKVNEETQNFRNFLKEEGKLNKG